MSLPPSPPPFSDVPTSKRLVQAAEALGLGKAYRARPENPEKQRLPTQSTEIEGNKFGSEGSVITHSHVGAPITSGASGARVDNENHIKNRIHVNQANFYLGYQSLSEARSFHTWGNGGGHETHRATNKSTSTILDLSVAAHTNSPPAMAKTTRVAQGEIEVKETVLETIPEIIEPSAQARDPTPVSPKSADQNPAASEGEAPPTLTPSTKEAYAELIRVMGEKIIHSYGLIAPHVLGHIRRSEATELNKRISLQRLMFGQRNRLVLGSISKISFTGAGVEEYLVGTCDRVFLALQFLQEQLDSAPSISGIQPSKKAEDGKKIKVDRTSHFKKWFQGLEAKFNQYVEEVSELISDGGNDNKDNHSDFKKGLEKLSTEAQASSHLKQCLSRACPELCHDHHTAYLSLEPDLGLELDQPDPSANRETRKIHHLELGDSPETTWQCHMAFKSTIATQDDLIWLKVVSNIMVGVSSSSQTVIQLPSLEDVHDSARPETPASERDEPAYILENQSRKRPAPSVPYEHPSKTQVTRPGYGRRLTDPSSHAASGIQVCPEYLRQHDTAEHAIMKMVDTSGCDHRIFYLPLEKRSAYGAGPSKTTLDEVLRKRRRGKYRSFYISLFWKVHVARLVAEAVLRFDLRDSDSSPDKSIVLYGLKKKQPVTSLAPFLALTIEKSVQWPANPSSSDGEPPQSRVRSGRRRVLVDLGMVLLRLGIESDKELVNIPSGARELQGYIRSKAVKTEKISSGYAIVVRHCTQFFEEGKIRNDEDFERNFFQKIVQPLKRCEKQLLLGSDKRWSPGKERQLDNSRRIIQQAEE